jgi:hypothetical protein
LERVLPIIGPTVCCFAIGSAFAQSLPNLSVNVNTNGKAHVFWTVPAVDAVLQESFSLTNPGGWRASTLNVITTNCNCQVLESATNVARFFRLVSTNPPVVGIYLGPPTQLLAPHQMGMTDVPDMHTALLQQSNVYRLWIAGRFEDDTIEGATGLLLTTNFVDYTSGYSPGTTNAVPVFVPSSRGSNELTTNNLNFDADYGGADLVWAATNGSDLLMLYHAETWTFGTNPPNLQVPGWASVGLVRSFDNGISWTNRQAIITSSDPKPDTNPPVAQIYGDVEPGAIVASNFIYAYYAYFPSTPATNPTSPVIQVARSALTNDGAPGTWTNYFSGSFSQPALGGQGASIIPTVCSCTRPAQPWPVYSTYLNAYVLVFLCEEGWFFSTSTDLVTWNAPVQFFTAPNPEFVDGLPTDENVILVTPGNPPQVIGQTGIVLYAQTPAWKNDSHELWSRPFTFIKNP